MIKVSDRWDCLETWYTTISSVSLLEFICAEHHRQGKVQNKIYSTRKLYLGSRNFEPYEKVKLSSEIWSRNSSSRPIITSIIIINTSWNSKHRKSCNFYVNFGDCMLIRINLKVQRNIWKLSNLISDVQKCLSDFKFKSFKFDSSSKLYHVTKILSRLAKKKQVAWDFYYNMQVY